MNRNGRLNIQQLSMIGTMIFVVLCSFCVVAAFAVAVGTVDYGLWGGGILIIRVEQIVFRPKIVNSVSTSNDDRHRRGLTFSLMSRAHVGQDSQGDKVTMYSLCFYFCTRQVQGKGCVINNDMQQTSVFFSPGVCWLRGDSFGNYDSIDISIKWSLRKASASPVLTFLLFIYCNIHQ